ncbi:hypothetical protein [Sphingomonas sp. NFR15]|uniref:hypothetical protein n=1 Tax=Sphingomonas sp. NFR15 TaxID=1566282 RepID=UPI00115FA7A7|nr:hypothetical protein [Sphingomonas sp. NFR15]
MDVEDQARVWADAPTSDNKRALAAPMILRLIAAMRSDERTDLAKDQIRKAIRAMWRNDQPGASEHIRTALVDMAHKPVDIEWDDLAEEARKLEQRHPNDDPHGAD